MAVTGDATSCPRCARGIRERARYCAHCGFELGPSQVEEVGRPGRDISRALIALAAAGAVIGLTGLALAALAYVDGRSRVADEAKSRAALAADMRVGVERLERAIGSLSQKNARLAGQLERLGATVAEEAEGTAPLASRILRSVFTIETVYGQGSGFAAWTARGDTLLLTASHVVEDALAVGERSVQVRQKGRSYRGRIERTDPVNDLALIRVLGREIAPPLWQQATLEVSPRVGDELLLVGSPFGLEGSVTTGIVSRVAYNEIQTDASANPGNSGGPAVDSSGRVVGVLTSGILGGGGSVNFAVPIQRACVKLRRC